MQIRAAMAKINLDEANAEKTKADASRLEIAGFAGKLNTIKSAIEAAGIAATNPHLAAMVDDMIANTNKIIPVAIPQQQQSNQDNSESVA